MEKTHKSQNNKSRKLVSFKHYIFFAVLCTIIFSLIIFVLATANGNRISLDWNNPGSYNPHGLPYKDLKNVNKWWLDDATGNFFEKGWPPTEVWERNICEAMSGADEPGGSENFFSVSTASNGLRVPSIYIAGEKIGPLPNNDYIYQMYWNVMVVESSNEKFKFSIYVKGPGTGKLVVLDKGGNNMTNIEVEAGQQVKGYRAKTSNITLNNICIEWEKYIGNEEVDNDVNCVPFVSENYRSDYGESSGSDHSRGAGEPSESSQQSQSSEYGGTF